MDASFRQGLFSILLLHICLSQVLVNAETAPVPESIPPPEDVIVKEVEETLSAPAVEQEAAQEVTQEVANDGEEPVSLLAAEEAVEEPAPEAAAAAEAAEPTEQGAEPAQQEVEAWEELSQEVVEEVAATAGEEPAPEEEATAVEVGEPAGQEAAAVEVAVDSGALAVEPPQEEAPGEAAGQGDPTVAEAPEEVAEEVGQEAATEEGVVDETEAVEGNMEEAAVDGNETGASQASETEEADLTPGPADTYVPAQSQDPATASIPGSQEETNDVGGEIIQESNDFNEIITSKDELLNLVPAEPIPTLQIVEEEEEEEKVEVEGEVSVEAIPAIPATPSEALSEDNLGDETELVEAAADEGTALGLEVWKIGAISAAVFLFLETIVIIVYFLKCRKKATSGSVPVKAPEDCEAAQPIAEEATDSGTTAEEDQIQQNNISETVDMSQLQQEETMADIPLDPPVESSPEETADDVRTSVL